VQFLISDREVHFIAQVFAQLAHEEDFILVVIARHRPQSNGIAERFVRTLKEWLADKVWTSDQELAAVLAQFRAEYNDRPHQGLGIPGLSPNEFAGRIWLMELWRPLVFVQSVFDQYTLGHFP
jgi:transposase InsO family protein